MSDYGFPYVGRPDLSPYIYHLSGDHAVPETPRTAGERLAGILNERLVRALQPFGIALSDISKRVDAGKLPKEVWETQKACCFTEAPIGSLHSYFSQELARKQKFAPYGICVGRADALERGALPIWYSDQFHLAPILTMVCADLDDLVKKWRNPYECQALILAPRFELMKRIQAFKKMFWWEREWRCLKDFRLPRHGAVICPKTERARFQIQIDQTGHLNHWIIIHLEDSAEENLAKLARAIPEENVKI